MKGHGWIVVAALLASARAARAQAVAASDGDAAVAADAGGDGVAAGGGDAGADASAGGAGGAVAGDAAGGEVPEEYDPAGGWGPQQGDAGAVADAARVEAPSRAGSEQSNPPPRAAARLERLVHAPPHAAVTGEPVVLRMDFLHPQRIDRAEVHFRAAGGAWGVAPVQRASGSGYAAELPAQPPAVRALEYYVTVTPRDGAAYDAFGSAARPHALVVRPTPDGEQEAVELAQNRGQRLQFAAGGEYTNFGARLDASGTRCGVAPGATCEDHWYSVFGWVRYRFFRVVRSVSVRVDRLDGFTTRRGRLTHVGLVAATTTVEFRVHPMISLSASGILGANETTVQVGAGAAAEFGVGTPTRVELAVNGIVDFGVSASAWMRWYTVPDTPLGAGIEVTNQPGINRVGTRLLFEVARPLGAHFTAVLRAGYGTRQIDTGGLTGAAYLVFAL